MKDQDREWTPSEMPTLVLSRCARTLARQTNEGLKSLGISAAQLPVLVALKDGAGRTQKQLAEIAAVEQPSMAQLLARMERDGLVRREPLPSDGRSSLVFLTETTLERLELGRLVLRQIDDAACAVFTEAEKETLINLLKRLPG